MVCDCCLHTSNIIIRAVNTHIGWCTLLTPLLLNHLDIHFLFSHSNLTPTPPLKLKPHVIVQHHCTSFPLSLHPAVPPPLGTVDSWLTKSTVSGLEASIWTVVTAVACWSFTSSPEQTPAATVNTHTDTCDNKLSCFSLGNKRF